MTKNKIIHLIITVGDDDRYICNQACGITKEKSTYDKDKVTCKNCLQALTHHNPYCQKRAIRVLQDGELICYLDGDSLCIINNDFVNLQESPSVFIELTEKEIEEIKKLNNIG